MRQIQAHKKYQQYMSRVLEAAGDFHEINEIMSRYQTLLATHEVLLYELHLRTITFCVSRRRRKMYCVHARLCVGLFVCVSVCPRPYAHTTARTRM